MFPLPGWVVANLQFDPNRPARLWAALRGVFGGGAVARSDDLGRSWEMRSQRPDDVVFSLALVPGEDGRLFLGARTGVWGSTDGGVNWRQLSGGHPDLVEVSSLLVHPQHPQTVLAGTYRRAFRSDDGGATWRGVFDGMVLDSQVFTLNAVPGAADQVWASTCGWVYKSDDLGAHWTRMREGLFERRTPAFTACQRPPARGTVAGVYVYDNQGGTGRAARATTFGLVVGTTPSGRRWCCWAPRAGGGLALTERRLELLPSLAASRGERLGAGEGPRLRSGVGAHGGPSPAYTACMAAATAWCHELSRSHSAGARHGRRRSVGANEGGYVLPPRRHLAAVCRRLPATRVERWLAADGRVVARNAGPLSSARAGRFVAVTLPRPPWSAAVQKRRAGMVAGAGGAWQLATRGEAARRSRGRVSWQPRRPAVRQRRHGVWSAARRRALARAPQARGRVPRYGDRDYPRC